MAVGAFTLLVVFQQLGAGSLRTWDESLTAERSREMLVSGQWLLPQLNWQPDFNKPPLYYWLSASLMALLGVGELAVRLPSALCTAGMVAIVAAFAWRSAPGERGGAVAALGGAFLLAADPIWVNRGREGMLDSPTLFLSWLAMLLLAGSRGAGPSTRAAVGAGIAIGAGILVKSPLPLLVLPAAVVGWRAEGLPFRARPLVIAGGIAIALGACWYALAIASMGEGFIRQHFGYSMAERIARPIEGHDYPLWYYPARWAAAGLAGLILSHAALAWALWRRDGALRFVASPLAFTATMAVALMAAASKRESYLVYILPGAALLAGVVASRLIQPRRRHLAVAAAVAAVVLVLFESRYEEKLDKNRQLEALAEKVLASGRSFRCVVTELPEAVVLFYLRAPRGVACHPPDALSHAPRPALVLLRSESAPPPDATVLAEHGEDRAHYLDVPPR